MPLKTYENIVLDVLRKTSGVTSICLKSSTALDILVGTTDATVRFSLDRNELFASIRRLKDVEKCKIPEIGIDHIIRFRGGTPHHGTILDASDIQEQVYRQARLVGEYCSPFLTGNFSEWADLEEYVGVEVENWKKEESRIVAEARMDTLRAEAEEAFRLRQFDKVIKLYNSIGANLSLSEKAKLEYAVKRSQIIDDRKTTD